MTKEEKDIKREEQRKALLKVVKAFLKKAKNREDKLVLVEDGKDTTNEYPYWVTKDEGKTPQEWVNGIMFHWEFGGMKKNLEMKIVLAQ